MTTKFRVPPEWMAVGLAIALPVLTVLSIRTGSTARVRDIASVLRGAGAALGLCAPLTDPAEQLIVALRLWRALTAAGVGGALGLSGALVQGVFRNGLASPSVLGITGGASLGAVAAVLIVGGYGPNLVLASGSFQSGLVLIPAFAFVTALLTATVVYRMACVAGQVSIPALLLIGIAVNTFVGGILQLAQVLVLGDWEVARSILAWTFGTLDDRAGWHASTVWIGLAVCLSAVPFLATELDLMQAGVEDAEALGVDTARVKFLALCAASMSAAVAVAVAGQIAFVGLVVPHIVRLLCGVSYKRLLPLSVLCGAVFLLGADLLQRLVLRELALAPGIMMSLIGGPLFVFLLYSKRREIGFW